MRVMGVKGLTLYHLKSHLQKYRLGKQLHKDSDLESSKDGIAVGQVPNISASQTFVGQNPENLQITEALRMQMEVQRKLHEQLEVQRRLQLKIEAQGKYLQSILEKARETLARHTLGLRGQQEAAKDELTDLVSKVSTEQMNSSLATSKSSVGPILAHDQHATALQKSQAVGNSPDCTLRSLSTLDHEEIQNEDCQSADGRLKIFLYSDCLDGSGVQENFAHCSNQDVGIPDRNLVEAALTSAHQQPEHIVYGRLLGTEEDAKMFKRIDGADNGYLNSCTPERSVAKRGIFSADHRLSSLLKKSRAPVNGMTRMHTNSEQVHAMPLASNSAMAQDLNLNSNREGPGLHKGKELDLNAFGWNR
ncbi:hypothetical protein O6H91_06G144000 [Diphasiastrum complanatum]|nr:hypothetical protein O6H91_06G144000 [Diphasiastrum complanatum]